MAAHPPRFRPVQVISGGQSGVDRGALDAAARLGIAAGGWCPRGRRAENGPIPPHYPLVETESAEYRVRTERNVRESDATLILCRGRLAGGSALTRRIARAEGKPYLVARLDRHDEAAAVGRWLSKMMPAVLNIAGPRESQSPGIAAAAEEFLVRLWSEE